MKFFITLLFTICCSLKGICQGVSNSYIDVDRVALAITTSQTTSTTDIANYIKDHFDTDGKKVRAIYTWVAANIRYNTDSIRPVIFEEDREQRIASALRRKKGVCENYASIFNDICLKSGLESLLIEGFTRQNGAMDKSPHEWCCVFIDNNWFLYDPTWDETLAHREFFSGSISYGYFQAEPEIFIQSHMPFDPMFQLLPYPVTYKEFYNGSARISQNRPYFNFADSISAYQKLTSADRYLSAATRIEHNGPPNTMITNNLNKLKMDMEIIYEDKDTTLYNSAVADYNEALTAFNIFIHYRNSQFIPTKSENDVQEIFKTVEKGIQSANIKIAEINRSRASLTLNTVALENVLISLTGKVNEQQAFLREYLSSVK